MQIDNTQCRSWAIWNCRSLLQNSVSFIGLFCTWQVWLRSKTVDEEAGWALRSRETCNTLQHTATHCNTLQHSALWMRKLDERSNLERPATRCNTLQRTATLCTVDEEAGRALRSTSDQSSEPCEVAQYPQQRHCNTLQHSATYCNTLQHTATHCNTLQHTATHCHVWSGTVPTAKATYSTHTQSLSHTHTVYRGHTHSHARTNATHIHLHTCKHTNMHTHTVQVLCNFIGMCTV